MLMEEVLNRGLLHPFTCGMKIQEECGCWKYNMTKAKILQVFQHD